MSGSDGGHATHVPYALKNVIRVACHGLDARAAVGFMTTVFMIFIGLGNGPGQGSWRCG